MRAASAPRLLLHAGPGAAVELVEEYASADGAAAVGGQYFTCDVAELFLEDRAQVRAAGRGLL